MEEIKCPKCGENENLHANYDYDIMNKSVIDYICNECGCLFSAETPELENKFEPL